MLPEIFRPLMWSYDFEKCDPKKMQNTIITNTVNYGSFSHWRWIRSFYGNQLIRERMDKMPLAFRDSVLKLAKIFFT